MVEDVSKSDDRALYEGDVHIEDAGKVAHWIREGQRSNADADVSYNQSRTVQGRVVAVIILLVGGEAVVHSRMSWWEDRSS